MGRRQFRRLRQLPPGRWRVVDPLVEQRHQHAGKPASRTAATGSGQS